MVPSLFSTWRRYGWTSAKTDEHSQDLTSILVEHADFADFLRKSGLLYAIRGYQRTLEKSNSDERLPIQQGILLDDDRHPQMLVDGNWMKWSELKELVTYDPVRKAIVSKNDPQKEWNYYYPNGLIPQSRFHSVVPTYKLSEAELESLRERAESNEEKTHFIQVFTSDNSMISTLSHTALRLIDNEGSLYSLGFETTPEIDPPSSVLLARTKEGAVASRDYDEFRPFAKRRVTTVALTEAQYEAAMDRVTAYSKKKLKFTHTHQNCTTFVADIMKAAGHEVDVRCTLIDGLYGLLPKVKSIPLIGPALEKVRRVFAAILNWIVKYLVPQFLVAIVVKISCVITNLVCLCFGGARGIDIPDAERESLDNREGLKHFGKLYRRFSDLFDSDAAQLYSPAKLVEWQMEQKSTFVHKYDGTPSLVITPQKC